MKTLLILGHSHVNALKRAMRTEAEHYARNGIEIKIYRLNSEKKDVNTGDISMTGALEQVAALAPQDMLVSILRGSQHVNVGLLKHPRPFDFMMPKDNPASIDQEIIPQRLVKAMFEELLRPSFNTMRKLSKASSAPMICLETPAPKEDEVHILDNIKKYAASQNIDHEIHISPAALRQRLWRIQHETQRELCNAVGVTYMPCPPDTLDENGYLKREYYWDDATHANPAYGTRVLQELSAAWH